MHHLFSKLFSNLKTFCKSLLISVQIVVNQSAERTSVKHSLVKLNHNTLQHDYTLLGRAVLVNPKQHLFVWLLHAPYGTQSNPLSQSLNWDTHEGREAEQTQAENQNVPPPYLHTPATRLRFTLGSLNPTVTGWCLIFCRAPDQPFPGTQGQKSNCCHYEPVCPLENFTTVKA